MRRRGSQSAPRAPPRSEATIPGTGRRPGQTVWRARSASELTAFRPIPISALQAPRTQRHFHHTGCRISSISDCWRIRSGHRRLRITAPVGAHLAQSPADRRRAGIRQPYRDRGRTQIVSNLVPWLLAGLFATDGGPAPGQRARGRTQRCGRRIDGLPLELCGPASPLCAHRSDDTEASCRTMPGAPVPSVSPPGPRSS